ncbi:MAG TPA: ABC transporter ATP-binding protein [Acidimicrobiales bacterium]|jgi:ATP-binding cassette subfamily B protein|nr:ABC transporter ATP-binding protein [Acidimicrobiales bacterium]
MSTTTARSHQEAAGSAYSPLGVTSRYQRPRGQLDPDVSKTWLRRVLPILKGHRGAFLTFIGLSFSSSVLQILAPNVINRATNAIQGYLRLPAGTGPPPSITSYVVELVVLGLLAGLTGLISRYYMYRTAYDIEFDLRNLIYEHLSTLSFGFYDRVQSGQLISRANSDIRSVQMYTTFAPLILVQCSIGVVAFGFMLYYSALLALVALAMMPLLYRVGVRMRNVMFPISWVIQARLAGVATVVDENVNGVRVVKSFAQEDAELQKLAAAAKKVEWAYIKDADIRGLFTPWVQNIPQVGLAMVLGIGGWLVINGSLNIGEMLAFNLYFGMLQAPFMMLGQLVMMGQRAKASAERIFEILDEPTEITERPGASDLDVPEGRVSFRHVAFAYGSGPTILDDLTFEVEPGEAVAIVGETGSGKSTVARLLTRFYDVTGGSVEIDGHDVRDVTLGSLRAAVGVVQDEPFLFSVSIRENIAYGRPDATLEEVEAAARAANAHEFVVKLPDGYDTVVGERGYTLSGGQRQRVAIARTLLLNPPVLVLDDATSSIDVHIEQEIHAALGTLLQHRTTLVIAHRLSTIALADRVILLDGGRVAATGTHAELLATTPLYGEVLARTALDDNLGDPTGGGT